MDGREDVDASDAPDAASVGGSDPGSASGGDVAARETAERGLLHLDDRGRAHMVDVSGKDTTTRTAVAECRVMLAPATARLLADGALPKGDALAVARVAGIQAAKRTPELLPLCHQVALTSVALDIDVEVDAGVAVVTATVVAADRTGVEMEALVAASVAALTLYDLCKSVQKDVVVTDVRLRRKTGGRSGELDLP